jgi:translation initiation factor IF-2
MSRVRVYELAKQLSISNKEVLDLLEEYGMPASNYMSTVDDNAAEFVIRRVRRGRAQPQPPERGSIGASRPRGTDFASVRPPIDRDLRRGDEGQAGGPPRRSSSLGGIRRRGGRLRQTDVIPAKPAVRFDMPTVDDGKLIKFDTTTYFDARSSSGGMRAIFTSRAKPVEKPKKDQPSPAVETSKAVPKEAAEELQEPAGVRPAEAQPVEVQPAGVQPDGAQPAGVLEQAEKTAGLKAVTEAAELEQTARGAADAATVTPEQAADRVDEAELETAVKRRGDVSRDEEAKPAAGQPDRGRVSIRRVPSGTAQPGVSEVRTRPDRAGDRRPSGQRRQDWTPVVPPVRLIPPTPGADVSNREAGRRGKKDRRREGRDSDELVRERKSAGKRSAKRVRLSSVSLDLDDIDVTRRAVRGVQRLRQKAQEQPKERRRARVEKVKTLSVPDEISVRDFALRLEVSAADLIKKLMSMGVMATINQEIDFDTAEVLADEYGVKLNRLSEIEEREVTVEEIEDDPESLVPRPPVVTVLGHVDHGKTSLLDKIRKSHVTDSEAGGITQHIGAYQVDLDGRKITFIDTPGHEAFTAMRARGAQVTDMAVLVVAADDGVMPQTVEAINHAKAAKVPIIVAVNKIDKPQAQPERIRQQLTEYELVPEDWGGETVVVDVSALTGEGIDELLEMILLVSDVRELKANPDRPAKGHVVEAELDRGKGPVATVLIETGTLRIGDTVIAGGAYGRVRAMTNDRGQAVTEAGPSVPVEIVGFNEVPLAGDVMHAVAEERIAREMASKRQERKRTEELLESQKVSLDDFYKRMKEGQTRELGIIVKGDVQGSVEAVCQSLEKLSTDEVKVSIVHAGVGAITESDVMLASTADAIIIGFNVRPDAMARRAADREKIDIRLYRIIYEAIDDVKKALSGLLEPETREKTTGHAEVRATFKVPRAGTVAGCYVTDGSITRNALIRVIRDGVVVHEGSIESLKRFKDDVREVAEGFECGIGIERFNDIREGDIIEAYVRETVKRSL